jgi:pyrroline-5-carboxylate reductase
MVHVKGKKVGIIGAGNMGQAIIKALVESETVKPDSLYVTNRSPGKIEKMKKLYNVQAESTNEALIDACDVVIIAVKPQDLAEAIEPCRSAFSGEHVVISLAAGVDFRSLRKLIPEGSLIRVMANTPVFVRKGVIGFCAQNAIYETLIQNIFSPMGTVVKLEEGDPFEAFSVASASGTGFIFELMSYWQDWIEEHGIEPQVARDIVVQTFLGTAALAEKSTETVEELQNKVVSKKGMTAAGLESMRSLEVEGLLRMSFNKAALRYKELGNQR